MEVEEEEDTQGTQTTLTRGAKENMIDTMERKSFYSLALAVFLMKAYLHVLTSYCSGISPEEKRGGRGPWNWGCAEETARLVFINFINNIGNVLFLNVGTIESCVSVCFCPLGFVK